MRDWRDLISTDFPKLTFCKLGKFYASLAIALSAASHSSAQSSDGIVIIDSFDIPLGNGSYLQGSCNEGWSYASFPGVTGIGILGTRSAGAYKGQNGACYETGVDFALVPGGSLRVDLYCTQRCSWAEARASFGYTAFGSMSLTSNAVIVLEGVGTIFRSPTISVGISSVSGNSSLTRALETGTVGTLVFPISEFVGSADLTQITNISLSFRTTGSYGYDSQCSYSANRFLLATADCNNDGVADYVQLLTGQLTDTNDNRIPDCCDQGVPCFDADSDGVTNSLDNCPSVPNASQSDCDQNGIGDACQADSADCNSNGIPDYCDIASGSSTDADSNGVPDSCQADCNLNNLPDAWEITTGRVPDLNADGIPDTCQGAAMVRLASGNLGAPSGDTVREWVVTKLPPSETDVIINVDLRGDLNGQTEWVDIVLNNAPPRRFFDTGGNDCPAVPDRAVITLTRAQFNGLIGADGTLSVRVVCPSSVDDSECKGDGLTEVTLSYVGVTPTGDCNGNQRLDIAETHDGTTPDCNANTVPDSCDIARGAVQDCNLNGIPDSCEIAQTPAVDCDHNGMIDTCEIASRGTAADCDQNGRIDSCQVTETPGTDCNGNLRPDACDIAAGTSADRDANATPDECQTVHVPVDYGTIQAAIDTAPASTMRIIDVAAGTYAGPIDFKGKPVIVRGTSAASTVIEGNGGQQLSVVRFTGGEPAIAALERVTVRGGLTGSPIPGSPQSLVGGGIFGYQSAANVRDCIVEQNVGGFGGGAYFLRCTGEVRGCTFRGNNSSADGGGLQSNQGTQQVVDCVIQGNVTNSRGGGLHLVQGTPTLTRVQVTGNSANNLMGGISWYSSGSPTAKLTMSGCTVTGNTAMLSYGGVGITDAGLTASSVTMQGTQVCTNTPRPNVGGGRWTDLGNNTVCDCTADLNLDGVVNGADMGLMLSSWGSCGTSCPYDLDGNGVINGADLGLLLSAWGPCGN